MGRVTASAFFSRSDCFSGSTPSRFFFLRSYEKANCSYSSQVTSLAPIQNGSIWTVCWGSSSLPCLASPEGAPISKVPPGIGTMSNLMSVPGMVSTYGLHRRG